MTVRLGDRTGPEPDGGPDGVVTRGPDGVADDEADDETWWDRHGWEVPVAATTDRRLAAPGAAADPGAGTPADRFGWSTLLLSAAVVGGLVTLPVLGFTGGPGRVLTPTLWALIGTAVGVRLSHREPRWDLGDPRRVELLLVWAVAYAVVGLRFFEGVAGWWVPATVLTALAPPTSTRVRAVLTWARPRLPHRRTAQLPDLPDLSA